MSRGGSDVRMQIEAEMTPGCILVDGGMQIYVGDGSVRVWEEATRVDAGSRARYAASSIKGVLQNI